jgi:DNA-binding transcriptional ArsR family regulator
MEKIYSTNSFFMKTYFSNEFLEKSTETLRAIAHPIRIAIVDMLHKRKQLTVTEIFEQLEIEQAIVSHHLRILKDQNVVEVNRDGKNSIYFLTNDSYYNIVETLMLVI